MEIVITIIVLGVIAIVGSRYFERKRKQAERKRRQAYLLNRYGDSKIVEDIMAKKIWQGMSKEQLIDSWGHPEDQGQRVMKTKTTTTYKYNQTGQNRFQSRVTLENDVVIGWQQK